MKKIFKIRVEYETVIMAESIKDAESIGETIIREIDDPPDMVNAEEILCIGDLPNKWNGDYIPWNTDDDDTIEQILKRLEQYESRIN